MPAEAQEKPKNTGVGSLSLLQWIFLTQESNQDLLHCRRILYQLSYQGIIIPGGEALLKRTKCSGVFQKWLLFSFLLPEAGDFSLMFTVGTWSSSWRQISQYYGSPPMSGYSRSCLARRLVCTEPVAIHQPQLAFPSPPLVPRAVTSCSALLWRAAPLCRAVCLSSPRSGDFPASFPLLWIKKSC